MWREFGVEQKVYQGSEVSDVCLQKIFLTMALLSNGTIQNKLILFFEILRLFEPKSPEGNPDDISIDKVK